MKVILLTYNKKKSLMKVTIIFLQDNTLTITKSEEEISNEEYEDNQVALFQNQDVFLSDGPDAKGNLFTSTD